MLPLPRGRGVQRGDGDARGVVKTRAQILALWPRAIVCLVAAGTSVFLACLAWAQLQLMLLPGSSLYALDVASAVMVGAALLAMADIAVRWFWFLCSGRLPRSSRLWSRGLTWLLAVSGAAVLVCLFILTP